MLSAAYNYLPKKKKHVERKQSIVIQHRRWALLVLGDSGAKITRTAGDSGGKKLYNSRP
jgi:hypothetical protein